NGNGSCSSICIDPGVKVTQADTNRDRDYCAAPETGGLGVSTTMTKEECQAANRIFITSIDVCSARCSYGYRLNAGKCEEVKRSTAEVVVVCDPSTEDCSPACEATGTAQNCSVVTAAPPKICDPETERCNKTCEETKRTNDCRIPTNPYVTVAVVAQAPEETTVDVNSELTQEQCALLGREWIETEVDGTKTAGCSTATCASEEDMIVENEGNPYCQNAETQSGYVAPISQEDCEALHREWIEEVDGCAQVPLAEGETDKFVNAEQCVAPYTTYYVHENGQGECFEPSVVDRIQAVAELFGAAFNIVRDAGPQAFCNLQPSYHWDDEAGECKGDRDVTGTVDDEEIPVSLQATPHSASVVSVNVAALNTSSYTLYYGPENSLVPVTCDTQSGTIGYGTCFVTGLKAAAVYEFSAKVAGSDKVVAKSNAVQTPTACVPFTVEPISNTQVRVSWQSVPGADYYTVQHDDAWPSGQELGPNGSLVVDRRDASDDYRVNSHSAPGFDNTCPFKTQTGGGAAPVSAPPTPKEIVSSMNQKLSNYGVKVSLEPPNKASTYSKWSTITSADTQNLQTFSNHLTEEFSKYPKNLVSKTGLKTIGLVKDLRVSGTARAAAPAPSITAMIYDVNMMVNAGAEYSRLVVSHEYWHYIDYASKGSYRYGDSKWEACNPKNFTYGNGGETAYDPDSGYKAAFHPKQSFITAYAQYGIEEDRAELFSWMMYKPSRVKQLDDKGIDCKIDRLTSLVRELSPGMSF
ncbi:MAG TPA: hypothetical protein VGE30_01955, partial [Candidatus Saccharimonadales bacterium]